MPVRYLRWLVSKENNIRIGLEQIKTTMTRLSPHHNKAVNIAARGSR